MDKPKVTPKDFFLWAGAMLALYVSVFSFLGLMFEYINYAYPDPLEYFPADPYTGGISYQMASLIVLVPLFLVLMYFIDRDIKRDASRREVWVRRWALVLTIFVAAATLAIDLIVLLMNFFNGGLTLPFLLKIVLVFLVAAAGLMHFIADLRDYWQTNPALLHRVGWGVGVLTLLTIFSGFLILGTPWQARLYQFDAQKVSDLQQLQSDVVEYYQQSGMLPADLATLNNAASSFTVPADLQAGDSYVYEKLSARSFNLCATFNADSAGINSTVNSAPMTPGVVGSTGDNWQHGSGYVCYLRTIDTNLYPAAKPAPTS